MEKLQRPETLNNRIKEQRKQKEQDLTCESCGKGHLQFLMINAGNIEKIITCDLCEHRQIMRKDNAES